MLRVNDVVTFTAESYSNRETVGTVDGYTVFVPFLLTGERARVRINYVKKNVAYADVTEILLSSPQRALPHCEFFGKCGGCSLSHMSYAEQLRFKQNKVALNLSKIGGLDVDVLPCVPSPSVWGYRNKISLPVRGKKGAVKVGMFERDSHKIVDVRRCALCGEWAQTLVSLFAEYCNMCGIEPYDERSFAGCVRHLTARYEEDQLLVTVVSNGEFTGDLRPLQQSLARRFERFGLFVNVNTARNNVILGEKSRHVCGLEYIEGEHLGVKFRLSPDSFFQVNDGVKDLIYAKARQLLDLSSTEIFADCFSGVGLLTNVLTSERFETYAIEIEPSAAADAKSMAVLNGTPRLTNVCGDVAKELPKIVAANRGKKMTVLVDPPRKGLNVEICNALKEASPNCIVYVSCDSATLARDLATLSDVYSAVYVEPYDMFPQTDQVETLVLLKRSEQK